MTNHTAAPTHVKLINESSLRFAVMQHLSSALNSLANSVEFTEAKTEVKALVNGKEICFSVEAVDVFTAYDLNCSVLLGQWTDGELVARLDAQFDDYGRRITLGDYLPEV